MDTVETFMSLLVSLAPKEANSSEYLDKVVDQIAKEMGADLVMLFGWNETSQAWFYLSSIGLANDFRQKGILPRAWQSLPTIVFKAGENLYSQDISKDRAFIGQMIRGTLVSTFSGTTLYNQDARFGSLCIGYNRPDALTEDTRGFFLSFSKQLGPLLASFDVGALLASAPNAPTPRRSDGQSPLLATQGVGVPATGANLCPAGDVPTVTPTEENAPRAMNVGIEPKEPLPEKEPLDPRSAPDDPTGRLLSSQAVPASGPTRPLFPLSAVPPPLSAVPPPPIRQERINPVNTSVKGRMRERDSDAPPRYQEAAESDRNDIRIKILESFFPALSSVFLGEDFSKEILRKMVALMGCDSGYLLKLDVQSQRLFPIASEGIFGEIVKRIEKSGVKPDPILGKALDRRAPILVPFQDWKSSLKKRLCGEAPLQSAMMTSIRFEDGTWGILSLFHRTQTFSQKDLKLLEWVGEKIGFLLDIMTNWDTFSKKMERLSLAHKIMRSIVKGGAVVIPSLLNGVKSALRASNCYLLLLDEQKNLLYGAGASNYAPEGIFEVEIRMEENGVVPITVKQNHFMVVENALSDNRIGKKWTDHFRSRSLLSVPLVARERVIGVLVIDETAYFRSFTEAEIETVVSLAPSAAIAIEMAAKYQEALQRQERQDHLSMTIFHTHEQERRQTANAFGNGTGALLEQARKQIKETGAVIPLDQIESRRQLEDACLKLEKAVSELEKISTDLYPYQLEAQGLIPALRGATEAFSKSTGVSVQMNAPSAIKMQFQPW